MTRPTVIVVGAGNAALVSALSAHESGAKVTICEAANEGAMGGNSRYTFAGFRFGSQGVDDVKALVPALSDAEAEIVRKAPYTPQDFFNHLMTLSNMRADPELCEMLAKASYDTLAWMKRLGIEWDISISELPKEPLWRLSPGSVFASGRGKGLIKTLLSAAQSRDIEIHYDTSLESIIKEDGRVTGAVFQREASPLTLHCDALILACGSFEASKELRESHMGPDWAAMKVRGTRFNTGKGLIAALAVGAQPHGNWASGHGVPVDAASKAFGELALGETTRRCLFQYGITVDRNGKRFMDEGQDRKTIMYGITGVEVARQPSSKAFQIFDAKIMTANFEKIFYFSSSYLVAQTLDELALMMGIPRAAFVDEVGAYNAAIDTSTPFDPSILDGRAAKGVTPPRSNFALSIDMPPYFAFPVSGGITFAYAGVKTNTRSEVLDVNREPIKGLYAAGEMAGGYFTHAYPANAGLSRGAVTGYITGKSLLTPKI